MLWVDSLGLTPVIQAAGLLWNGTWHIITMAFHFLVTAQQQHSKKNGKGFFRIIL